MFFNSIFFLVFKYKLILMLRLFSRWFNNNIDNLLLWLWVVMLILDILVFVVGSICVNLEFRYLFKIFKFICGLLIFLFFFCE